MDGWGMTNIGKRRAKNQDTFYLSIMHEAGQAFCSVCDGMGGVNGGELASSIAANHFAEQLPHNLKPNMSVSYMKSIILNLMSGANAAVFEESLKKEELVGMGTTVVCVLIDKLRCVFGNVGDSRAYLINDAEGIQKITSDHSIVEEKLRRGELTPEEAKIFPGRNIITRAVGTESTVECDVFARKFFPGESVLLCSDGLTNELSEEEILSSVREGGGSVAICKRLIDNANRKGGRDNITAAIIMF